MWPAQFTDAQLAMRWVRSHASLYGIDPTHICAEGGSSGAELALLLGVVPSIDHGDMQGFLRNVSPRADCVISLSGITDMISLAKIHKNVLTVLVGPNPIEPSRVPSQEVSASPALRVQNGGVPTLIVHGVDDDLVPFSQAVEMQDALAHANTPAWLVSYDGGHALSGLNSRQIDTVWSLVEAFAKWRRLPAAPQRLSLTEAISQLQ